jgi:L-seryl-tRNA(Ser) seleniumtransferase
MKLNILPPVHDILRDPRLPKIKEACLKRIVRACVEDFRRRLPAEGERWKSRKALTETIIEEVRQQIAALLKPFPSPVINGTGVIVHTNLGRAPLGAVHLAGYCNLEWDAATQKRGNRDEPVAALLRVLTGAEAALAVNNCASALLLALNTMANARDVLISRSELVEIGGGFRIPEILGVSGCRLVEVGTTNKTRIGDYEKKAVRGRSVLLKVHQSNFVQRGFVEAVSVGDLAALGRRLRLPLVHDIGSGLLDPSRAPFLAGEPAVSQSLSDGASVVVFSGDKLLGSVQAGIAVGKRSLIDAMRRNPLYRALRLDKVRIALLHSGLSQHVQDEAGQLPVWRFMQDMPLKTIRRQLRLPAWAKWVRLEAQAGGGSNPESGLESWGIELKHPSRPAQELKERFAKRAIPILGYIRANALCIDVRAFFDGDFHEVQRALDELEL